MGIPLTARMKNWIEGLGVHAALADASAVPLVIVASSCTVDGDTIAIPLSPAQKAQAETCIPHNSHVAIAPGGLGAVRAPYQFKGTGALQGDSLVVTVDHVYCTKPGYEAGVRMDRLGFEGMKEFDESRWKDITPPSRK